MILQKSWWILLTLCAAAAARPADRIAGPVDARQTAPVAGSKHRLAQPQYDRGPVDPSFPMSHMVLYVKPSAAQQADLERLLEDQQNPSSPRYRQWLTPEQFGDRYGLSARDHAQMLTWLKSQGFSIDETARAHNWIMFSGTAAQVEQGLHTAIHRYEIHGETHYANASEAAVPAALAPLVGGFEGLHDIRPPRPVRKGTPDNNIGSTHYLVPGDYATIYDIDPVYAAGIDGTGVNIGIVGDSTLLLTDIQMFRNTYGLPANDPKQVLAGTNPGLNLSYLEETDLDLEWAGAVAPGATLYYYYSTSYLTAITSAVDANVVQILSISYFSGSEFDISTLAYEPIFQQANAQGITVFTSSGDQGAVVSPDSTAFARFGPIVQFPADLPEVTSVGGTQFNEGTGTYWAASNNATDGSSALSYIPEIAWAGSGGGASAIFAKPAWQTGPGVPQDGARDIPDVSMAASCHDAFIIMYVGSALDGICGTSASAPAMAGVTALLNHSLMSGGQLSKPGLGNINPQLYRLAQASTSAFHDITSGGNTVTCTQGSPGCASGSYGYNAGPGYDLATGIGSLDVSKFIGQWNSATNPVTVTLSVTPAKATLNDTFQLTATVTPASGSGTPTGMVDFGFSTVPLGSAALAGGSATLTIFGYQLEATGTLTVAAQYRGDAAFSGGGATASVQVAAPTGVASVTPIVPVSVNASPDPSGLFWEFSLSLREQGGVAAALTDLKVDGQEASIGEYFPTASIPPNSLISGYSVTYRGLAYPVSKTFVFAGVDATGQSWTRQATIQFLGARDTVEAVMLSGAPLVMEQNTAADPSCQFSQRVTLTDISGYGQTVTGLELGNISLGSQIAAIFGTSVLAPYGAISGTVCWPAATAGTSDTMSMIFAAGFTQDMTVSFTGPPASAAPATVSPASLTMTAVSGGTPAQATLNISVPAGQAWNILVTPQNVTSGWLTVSPTSGTGPATVNVQASATGYEAGAYHADLTIQGDGLTPAATVVPVMFVAGDSSTATITSVTNAASGQSVAAPGMLAVIKGTALGTSSLVYSSANAFVVGVIGNVLVTVNGTPAPVHSVSPTQILFQIPYETGTGAAVVGVSYNGKAAGYLIQVTPAAPGLYADASGDVTPVASVQAGKTVTLNMTGDGLTSPVLPDGTTPGTANSLQYKPALPISLTVGGQPAFLNSYGVAAGMQGITSLNVTIPASTAPGPQAVVVTVNGVASPAVNLTVTP